MRYRLSEEQLARIALTEVICLDGTELIDRTPHRGGAPIRFSSDEYVRLHAVGVLGEDERVELVEGNVIESPGVTGRVSTCVFNVDDYLRAVVGPELRVTMRSVLHLPPDSVPLPSLMLLRRAQMARGKLPEAVACMLAVEVADTSAIFVRTVKRDMYARAGIPEYWVVDLTVRTVVQHLHPLSGAYQAVSEHPSGGSFVSPVLNDREVRVNEVLGPA